MFRLKNVLPRLVTLAFTLLVTVAPSAFGATKNLWLTKAEIQALPMSGGAWNNVLSVANGSLGTPDIVCQTARHGVRTYAVALVAVRTGQAAYYTKAHDAIASVMGTELTNPLACPHSWALAVGRNLAAYVIAADLIDLPTLDPTLNAKFSAWAVSMLQFSDMGYTVQQLADFRPSNAGTLSAASVVAIAAYTGNTTLLNKMALEYQGWLGNTSAYSGFRVPSDGTQYWLVNPNQPQWASPASGVLSSLDLNISGALPADMVRGGYPSWCPGFTTYPMVALEGTYLEAELLYRRGFTGVYGWQNSAVLRTMQFMYRLHQQCGWSYPTFHTNNWEPWFLNFAYGSSFPTVALRSNDLGMNMSFTDWTHNRKR